MKVIVGKSNIYHREGCMYVKRMKEEYKKMIKLPNEGFVTAESNYRFCQYCCRKDRAFEDERSKNARFILTRKMLLWQEKEHLFGATEDLYWKFEFDENEQLFTLYRQEDPNDYYTAHEGVPFIPSERMVATRSLGDLVGAMNQEQKELEIKEKYDLELPNLQKYMRKKDIEMDLVKARIYIRTMWGSWYLDFSRKTNKWFIHHMNNTYHYVTLEEALAGEYHKQKDNLQSKSIMKAMRYIYEHDSSLNLTEKECEALPQHTRQQKNHYKRAKNRAVRASVSHINDLFAMIEKGSNLQAVSVW